LAVTDIPPLPEAALYVLSIVRKPHVSAAEVAQALGSDESIALRLLAIANSAYFATSHRITTLSHCVAWLGLEFVGSTLVALGVDRLASGAGLPRRDRLAFWQHNMAVAACCELITSRLPDTAPGEAYLVGLCHDLGKLVLALTEGEAYAKCLSLAASTGRGLYEIETETLGIDHALVGASAMREWKLSPDLVYMALNHHEAEPADAQSKLLPVLMLAQGVCGTFVAEAGSLAAAEAETRRQTAMRVLCLGEATVAEVTRDLESSLAELQSVVMAMAG
jgi:HD-like signal output (HDOD) protein